MTVLVAELKKTGANSMLSFYLCFLNKTLTVIWYLKHLISSNKTLNMGRRKGALNKKT